MLTPTPDQLRDFFKSDIFQVEKVFEENYELAIDEFYKRFAPAEILVWEDLEKSRELELKFLSELP